MPFSKNIGALANVGDAMKQNIQKISDDGQIAEFSGGGFDSVKIFKIGDGFYGDTGDFDFTAGSVEELMEKLNRMGATNLNFGEIK